MSRRSGMTLLEVVIAVAIFGLLAAAVFSLPKDVLQFNRYITGGLIREAEIRRALKAFSSEMRSASTSSTGSYPIEAAAPTSLTFFADIDNDGLKERLRYFLSGTTLKRGVLKPSGAPLTYNPANEITADIVRDITGPAEIFSYFDSSYDGTGQPLSQPVAVASIRFVRLTITADPNASRPPAAITASVQSTIRNLRGQ